MENKKIKILYLFPGPVYRPDLPNFRDRFEMLSENFEGEVYSWPGNKMFEEFKMGAFVYRGLISKRKGLARKYALVRHIFQYASAYNKKNKVDVIVCYDPMFTGGIGSVLKLFFKCKLIVEVNSENYTGAIIQHYGCGMFIYFKDFIFKLLSRFSLEMADGIKVLSKKTKDSVPCRHKKIFVFHDFIPVEYFYSTDTRNDNYVLFLGYPFRLKGVDLLIKAFKKISNKYPKFSLLLIGHEIEKNAKEMFLDLKKIKFLPGIHYDEAKEYFQRSYCFVISSRTEGMGRVLIEAMACGKPVIGSNVGGIPDVIQDGCNGFLFESENVDDLAGKLDKLLSDPQLAMRMGEEGRRIVDEKFSSEKYVDHFKKMIGEVLYGA